MTERVEYDLWALLMRRSLNSNVFPRQTQFRASVLSEGSHHALTTGFSMTESFELVSPRSFDNEKLTVSGSPD